MVWAPNSEHVIVRLSGAERRIVPMVRDELGYHVTTVDSIAPDSQFVYPLPAEAGPRLRIGHRAQVVGHGECTFGVERER